MAFNTIHKKKAVVQIIPMIDILTILLIFFVLTSTWKKNDPSVKIDLPKSSKLKTSSVKTQFATIYINSENKLFIDNKEIAVDDVAKNISEIKKQNPEVKIKLNADGKIHLQTLVTLWDQLAKVGYNINDLHMGIKVFKE